ncbi:MAG: SufS family cysteine desulfurase [Oscillospiraceae bacterium]|nr:SufS family cysteine desulfurase [Oscillospiraceae bacterium]
MWTPEEIRRDFPILGETVNGRNLVYLDNAATTQMPEPVLEKMCAHYRHDHANVHRGIHTLSERSTEEMEQARCIIQEFIGAEYPEEIIFTSGATDSINLLARSLSFGLLKPGDEILTTEMEHHANLIPWQEVARRCKAKLRIAPITASGDLDYGSFQQMLTAKTRLVAVTGVSNVTGTVNDLSAIIRQAHMHGAWVLVDASQMMRHQVINVKALDCDFLCFSGHKMMGPTGTGVLYGKKALLEQLPPDRFGGGMVDEVRLKRASYGDLPYRLEAGTPNIAGIIGLGAAAWYLSGLGIEEIAKREKLLLTTAEAALRQRASVTILGEPQKRAGCISFNVQDGHCFDVARLLDQLGIAVRSGHHCAQPLLRAFGLDGAVRISPAFYNTTEEIIQTMDALDRCIRVFGKAAKR